MSPNGYIYSFETKAILKRGDLGSFHSSSLFSCLQNFPFSPSCGQIMVQMLPGAPHIGLCKSWSFQNVAASTLVALFL